MKGILLYAIKLYGQELGYRKGVKKQAGRYFLISKKAIGFFPPLSTLIRNDSVLINLIPPSENKPVLSKLVFHNDKIIDNKARGRDEFRLYLNSGSDPDRDYFQPNDIVVFGKEEFGGNDSIYYRLWHFPVREDTLEYRIINDLIKSKGFRGHLLVSANSLPFIDLKSHFNPDQLVVPEDVKIEALEKPMTISPLPEEVLAREFQFTNMIRENAFRELLLYFYDYRCAVTGTSINYGQLYNLEAAHIIPEEYGGPPHPKNGMPLSRDMHWAFDKGFFSVDASYTIQCHDNAKTMPAFAAIQGKRLLLPQDSRAHPSLDALAWHRETVFGIFSK